MSAADEAKAGVKRDPKTEWHTGRLDMRTLAHGDEDYVHFVYPPNGLGIKDRWGFAGPGDGSKRDPQIATQALCDVVNAQVTALEAERDALRAERDLFAKAVAAVRALIAESYGVDGLHRNGDVATWAELSTGGRFEEWLIDLDNAPPTPLEPKP